MLLLFPVGVAATAVDSHDDDLRVNRVKALLVERWDLKQYFALTL